jgi:hypothetical protein
MSLPSRLSEKQLAIREENRCSILSLEDQLKKLTQADIPIRHYWSPGLYAREMSCPAGTLLTGKIHRLPHLSVLSKGSATVWTEAGCHHLQAPATIASQPGTKRVFYAHTDLVWTTFHVNPTDETDVAKLEEALIAPDYIALGPVLHEIRDFIMSDQDSDPDQGLEDKRQPTIGAIP